MKSSAEQLYLDLLKRSLTNLLYLSDEAIPVSPSAFHKRWLVGLLERFGYRLVRKSKVSFEDRKQGHDWPPTAQTMIGLRRLDQLQTCIETILTEKISGDLLEAGVWRGGASILMRAVLKAYAVTDRRVWVADSFAGVPPPRPDAFPIDANSQLHRQAALCVPLATVRENFSKYDLLDEQVVFFPGPFRETLPRIEQNNFSLLRLDGDLYESTWISLEALYPKLSPGGFVILDDYFSIENSRRAADDYRRQHQITEPVERVDAYAGFWRKRR